MKKIFGYCFENWSRPIIFFGLTIIILTASISINHDFVREIGSNLFLLGLLGLLTSIIYQLTRKRWKESIFTLLVLIGAIILFIIAAPVIVSIGQSQPDEFADNLTIPQNIIVNDPAGTGGNEMRPDSITNGLKTQTDFQIYNSFQPGIYEYDFWTSRIEKGKIYLKAFEITHNEPLSVNRLPARSALIIYNPTDSIIKFSSATDFTIYEGDWGKPYAARFEVWFKPEDGGQELKLFEKIYRIEGWMR